jgi:hypothetical protein
LSLIISLFVAIYMQHCPLVVEAFALHDLAPEIHGAVPFDAGSRVSSVEPPFSPSMCLSSLLDRAWMMDKPSQRAYGFSSSAASGIKTPRSRPLLQAGLQSAGYQTSVWNCHRARIPDGGPNFDCLEGLSDPLVSYLF